ncbi:hypothetical protein BaRGS_00012327, partial [Batillaria attramentaria]
AGNNDNGCNCIATARYCDQDWALNYCSTTCNVWNTITCDPLISVPNASPKYNGQDPIYPEPRYMDIVTFECNPGYEQVGGVDKALRRVCNKTGQWVLDPDYQDTFSCQRVSCGSVPTVTLATPSRSSGVYEDVVTYTCNTGYYNTGTGLGTRTCNASAVWEQSDDDPVCAVAPPCPAPPVVYQATPNASSGVYPEDVSYVCNTGYDNSGGGAGLKTCNVNGQWEVLNGNPDPVCTLKPCGATPTISNAVASVASGYYGDDVTYTCATGYSQSGGGTGRHTCEATGVWTADPGDSTPTCASKNIVSCGAATPVSNADPSRPTGTYGDKVTYTCATGYSQTGGGLGRRTCTASGNWVLDSGFADPVCTIVSCGAATPVSNADPSQATGNYGDTATYSCATGYTQSSGGTGLRTCDATGTWVLDGADSDPVCTAVSCGTAPSVTDATPSQASGSYGDDVTYSCNTGYNQSGGGTGRRTCDATGTWIVDGGDTDPKCTIISCGAATPVSNADPSQSTGNYGDTATYSCATGYTQSSGGTGLRTCDATGTWALNGADPVCTAVSCGTAPPVTDATSSQASGSYGDDVTYSCNTGYSQSAGGTGRRTCDATGTWIVDGGDTDPACTIVSCGAVTPVSNANPSQATGNYGDTATYSCATGYSQSGGGTGARTCDATGTWVLDGADSDPVCTARATANQVAARADARVTQQEHGYSMVETRIQYPNLSVLRPHGLSGVSCGPPPEYHGATSSLSVGYYGDAAVYTCDRAHLKQGGGTGRTVCNASGLWEPDSGDTSPRCVGYAVIFINSQSEAQPAPPGSMSSAVARSNLHCASVCAQSTGCHGYTFTQITGVCKMNIASALPVISDMKKICT